MTPLTTEAAILAYLGREGEASGEQLARDAHADAETLRMLGATGHLLSRWPKSTGGRYYRLSAKGRRLFAKHREAVAAAYGLEG